MKENLASSGMSFGGHHSRSGAEDKMKNDRVGVGNPICDDVSIFYWIIFFYN